MENKTPEEIRLEKSKRRTQKYLWVSYDKWVEIFNENFELKKQIEELKKKCHPQ